MAPGTLGLATAWSRACWNWRWTAAGNAGGAAAWAGGRAAAAAVASPARLTVTHSSRVVIRCKGDARRDVRMRDLLYLLAAMRAHGPRLGNPGTPCQGVLGCTSHRCAVTA